MRNYRVCSRYENGVVDYGRYIRATTPALALAEFIRFKKLPNERFVPYKSSKRTYTFKTPYSWYTVTNVTPTQKELADALYQITKTYTDGTCYDVANPYSKEHVRDALMTLQMYSGANNYLDALEKMEAIGHVYKYKQP